MKQTSARMKKAKVALFSIAVVVILAGCQKENAAAPQQATVQAESNSATAIKTTEAGRTKLTLQPDQTDGQDTYVAFLQSDPNYANSPGDFAEELSMQSWTNGGSPLFVRSFIKFDKLSTIPSTSKVTKATLYLYAKGTSISNPNGNSVYPGSPYSDFPDNSCIVARVSGSNWNETTLSWNTQPAINKASIAVIPSSTTQWSYDTQVDVTSIVEKMVADPATNYGFRISLANESIYRSMIFASSENTDANKRPKLVVVYK